MSHVPAYRARNTLKDVKGMPQKVPELLDDPGKGNCPNFLHCLPF